MLNPFPELLTYSLIAPFLLRIAAAAFLLATAYIRLFPYRQQFFVSATSTWPGYGLALFWLLAVAEMLAGIGLLLGFLTQIAALIAAAVSLFILLAKRTDVLRVYSRPAYALILIIALSLLLSGAGVWAIDLPL